MSLVLHRHGKSVMSTIQSGSISTQLTPKPTSVPARVERPQAGQLHAKARGYNGGPGRGGSCARNRSMGGPATDEDLIRLLAPHAAAW